MAIEREFRLPALLLPDEGERRRFGTVADVAGIDAAVQELRPQEPAERVVRHTAEKRRGHSQARERDRDVQRGAANMRDVARPALGLFHGEIDESLAARDDHCRVS